MLTADPRTAARTRRGLLVWDVVFSVVALAVCGAVVALGVAAAVVLVAFLRTCPTCSESGALVSVGGPVVVAIATGFAGLVLTVLRIVDRRPGWPFALATLVVCALAVGLAGYGSAGFLPG